MKRDDFICASCRKIVNALPEIPARVEDLKKKVGPDIDSADDEYVSSIMPSQTSSSECAPSQPLIDNSLDGLLKTVGESPISRKRLACQRYRRTKRQKLHDAIDRSLSPKKTHALSKTMVQQKAEDFDEIMNQWQQKFTNPSTTRSEKVQLLTILPQSWSHKKIISVSKVRKETIRLAKNLYQENGILAKPSVKRGKPLDLATRDLVIDFYLDRENSRELPGMKDYVSVKLPTGNRQRMQKRLILCNLKELYKNFCEKHETVKIGFSSFALLRPAYCILAGQSGTHTVCVCTYHHNVKLMLEGCRIAQLTSDLDSPITNYTDCLSLIMCPISTEKCRSGQCSLCPDTTHLQQVLQDAFDDADIDNVKYSRWLLVDRAALETLCKSTDDFIEALCTDLRVLLPHDFTAKQQAAYHRELKNDLGEGEFVVDLDFAQNYTFVVQDAAQQFHWNNNQATIHPFVIYFRDAAQLKHETLTIISDCLEHNTVAVYMFQRMLVHYLKRKFVPKKIFYFSDGAPQQYKNIKNFSNLYHHKQDFEIQAEWHYFATGHGKGPCDGVSGTIKRLAARASLQLPPEAQITTPQKLYDWAKQNISGIDFLFCPVEDYDKTAAQLKTRFHKSKRVPGTQKFHAIIPGKNGKIHCKYFSKCETFIEKKVITG